MKYILWDIDWIWHGLRKQGASEQQIDKIEEFCVCERRIADLELNNGL